MRLILAALYALLILRAARDVAREYRRAGVMWMVQSGKGRD